MKIIQIAHALTKDDAASRQLINMDSMLRELGYDTAMYAHKVDSQLGDAVQTMEDFQAEKEDIVIYHMTTGTSFNDWVAKYPQKIVMYYHNITPAKFFFGNAWGSWWKCIKGRRQLKKIVKNTFFSWAASEYSRKELEELGLKYTKELSIAVEPEKYTNYAPIQEMQDKYNDDITTLLMVGRGVPHKKLDEAIAAIAWYKENLSKKIRLVLAGNIKPSYGKKLHKMVQQLKVEENVIFTGKISNEELCTWFRITDGVLSLSEHEGFCVPLIEAMYFHIPIIAYRSSAIPDTIGGGGLLLPDKTPEYAAAIVNRVISDSDLKAYILNQQEKTLQRFSYQNVENVLKKCLDKAISIKTH